MADCFPLIWGYLFTFTFWQHHITLTLVCGYHKWMSPLLYLEDNNFFYLRPKHCFSKRKLYILLPLQKLRNESKHSHTHINIWLGLKCCSTSVKIYHSIIKHVTLEICIISEGLLANQLTFYYFFNSFNKSLIGILR